METLDEKLDYVVTVIRLGANTSRKFDGCFEDSEADQLVDALVKTADKRGGKLLENLPRYISPSSIENARLGVYAKPAAHTPGPWRVHDRTRSRDNRIMVLHPDGQRLIADLSQGYASTAGEIPEEEREANARLIAAAPDLLNMLDRVLSEYLMCDPVNGPVCALTLEHAREAITKAKGE